MSSVTEVFIGVVVRGGGGFVYAGVLWKRNSLAGGAGEGDVYMRE